MSVHVVLQILRQGKTTAANVTFEWLSVCLMLYHVSLKAVLALVLNVAPRVSAFKDFFLSDHVFFFVLVVY